MQQLTCHYDMFSEFVCPKKLMSRLTLFCLMQHLVTVGQKYLAIYLKI